MTANKPVRLVGGAYEREGGYQDRPASENNNTQAMPGGIRVRYSRKGGTGFMSEIDWMTFKEYVGYARELVTILHMRHGKRLAEVWARRYARDCVGDDRTVFIHELLMCSEQESEAWNALELIVLYHHLHEIPLPQALQLWTSLVAADIRREPKTSGTEAYTLFVRDMAIVVIVFLLTEGEGIKATRSVDGVSVCGYEGGAACDVVGVALAELDGVRPEDGLKYKTIEGIWTASASPDSPLYRYGPSRRPFIEHPRFLLLDPEKSDGRKGPSENFAAFSTPFRILEDLLSAIENDEVQT